MNFVGIKNDIAKDRIMIAITTMMVVATIQSSINKMVPKTSYIKMIDVWLLYSFNIINKA